LLFFSSHSGESGGFGSCALLLFCSSAIEVKRVLYLLEVSGSFGCWVRKGWMRDEDLKEVISMLVLGSGSLGSFLFLDHMHLREENQMRTILHYYRI